MKTIKALSALLFSFLITPSQAQFGPGIPILPYQDQKDIAVGDIDNDGHQDLLCYYNVPGYDYALAWFKNIEGSGELAGPIEIETNLNYQNLIFIHDLNNDQINDILIVNSELQWCQGLGGGEFSLNETLFSIPSSTNKKTAFTDWDGDGDLDFLFHQNDNTCWLVEQSPTGVLNAPTLLVSGLPNQSDVAFADLNNDGFLEILVLDSHEIGYYPNENGSYGLLETVFEHPDWFIFILTEDVDQDGDIDIMFRRESNTKIFLLTNLDGAGTFSSAVSIIEPGGSSLYSAFPEDIDQDGDPDMIISKTNGAFVYMNMGNNEFEVGYDFPGDATNLRKVILADLNEDSNMDILGIANGLLDRVELHLNTDGAGYFFQRQLIGFTNEIRTSEAADIDNDGDLDLVVGGNELGWLENLDGNGLFSSCRCFDYLGTTAYISAIYPYDMDNDGDLDIITSWDELKTYENLDGQGTFGNAVEIGSSDEDVCADFNNDGLLDFIQIIQNYQMRLILNNGNGFDNFILLQSGPFPYDDIKAIDFDNDGDMDVIGNDFNTNVGWYENIGNNIFNEPVPISSTPTIGGEYEIGDIDQDGLPDLVIHNAFDDAIIWYKNTMNGFEPQSVIEGNLSDIKHLKLSDVDQNGTLDLIVANQLEQEVYIFYNFGGSFGPRILISDGLDLQYAFVNTGDLNNDGAIDIFVNSYFGVLLTWWESLQYSSLVAGIVFLDENENGQMEGTETGLSNQTVNLQPAAVSSWSNQTGGYTFFAAEGNFNLSCSPSDLWQFSTPEAFNFNLDDSNPAIFHFGLFPNQLIYESEPTLVSAPTRCGFEVPFWLEVTNTGTLDADAITTLELDPLVTFVNSVPEPDNITGNTLTWNSMDLSPTQSDQIYILLEMPDASYIGESIQMGYETVLLNNSNVVDTQSRMFSSTINCSYDPNDKLTSPSYDEFQENYTLFDQEILYTVRFQNTGSDTAFNIKIIDQLDSWIDMSTIRMISASHDYRTELNDAGKLVVHFEGIHLPDSSINFSGSQGYFMYGAKVNSSIEENTKIFNQASIFFDFNVPIITNTVENMLVSEWPVLAQLDSLLCPDDDDGGIQILFPVSPNISLQWGNGSTDPLVENLTGGDYELLVYNLNGLLLADTLISLYAPAPLQINFTSEIESAPGATDGSISILVLGGTTPYSYSWDTDPPQNTPTATNLETSTYTVTVTDGNGCSIIQQIQVGTSSSVNQANHLVGFQVSPNPSEGRFLIHRKNQDRQNWELRLYNASGQLVFSEKINNGQNDVEVFFPEIGSYYFYFISEDRAEVQQVIIIDK